MRAYCQHCDATEDIAPEEIYSPEFNFWCPRCQSILILQDDGGAVAAQALPAWREEPTRVDREELGLDERQAPTKEDDDPPRPQPSEAMAVTVAEPEAPRAPRKDTVALDAYSALAAELDPGIAEDELRRPTQRFAEASSSRKAITEREPKRSGAFPLPRTRADADGPEGAGGNGSGATAGARPASAPSGSGGSGSVRFGSRRLLAPGPEARQAAVPAPERAELPAVTTRVPLRADRGAPAAAAARQEIEQRLAKGIAPELPPLPNWDGGDTQRLRDLAAKVPPSSEEAPPLGDASAGAEPDDALEKIAVVEPMGGTTGTGSRTYERVESDGTAPAPAEAEPTTAAEPATRASSAHEDLDWYALLDEALPEEEAGDATAADASRVVIRLPETMAPQSEADAEQVRQLQAKLEARSLRGGAGEESDEASAEPRAQRLDSRRVRELAEDADLDAGHSAAKEDETRDFQTRKKEDDDETRDNPGREGGRDADAPTTVADPEKTAQLRSESTESARVRRTDPARVASEPSSGAGPGTVGTGRRNRGAASGIVIEQFNRSDLDPGLVCARDSSSPEADSFRQLYQRIFHSHRGNGGGASGNGGGSPRVVLVTSASKGEGKTTVAANLALVAARMPGRGALLVEADPRGGDLFRTFGLRMKAEGLLEALESGKDPAGFILQFKLGMLDVLPLGVPGSDAAELISSDRIGEVIRGLAQRYPSSVVIIDGSSVLHAPDPLVLARHVDGVVLVVRADVTPREDIERARDLIGPQRVIGVVLNHAGG